MMLSNKYYNINDQIYYYSIPFEYFYCLLNTYEKQWQGVCIGINNRIYNWNRYFISKIVEFIFNKIFVHYSCTRVII